MGTYYIRPTVVGSNDNWLIGGLATTLIDGFTSTTSLASGTSHYSKLIVGISGLARLDFTGDSFYLDSILATPVSFNGLPAGFTIDTAVLSVNYRSLGPGNDLYLQLGTLDEKHLALGVGIGAFLFDYADLGLPIPSVLNIWANGCGVRAIVDLGGTEVEVNQIYITGDYSIVSYGYSFGVDAVHISKAMTPRSFISGWAPTGISNYPPNAPGNISPGYNFPPVAAPNTYIENLSTSPGDISPGDIIRITSPGVAAGGIDLTSVDADSGSGISDVRLTYIDNNGFTQYYYIPTIYVILQSEFILLLVIPPFVELIFEPETFTPGYPDKLPVIIEVIGNGTQFVGTIPLGEFTLNLANTSGIYELIKNKTNDTLYNKLSIVSKNFIWLPDFDLIKEILFMPDFLGKEEMVELWDIIENEPIIPEYLPVITIFSTSTTTDTKIPDPFARTAFIGG